MGGATGCDVPAAQHELLLAAALAWAESAFDVWGHRHVALATCDLSVLARGEAMLASYPARVLGYEWSVLAGAYAQLGAPREDRVRCLEAGWARAWAREDLEQLGRITAAWARDVDALEAIERMRRVEGVAARKHERGACVYWWWAGLSLPEEGRRARDTALHEATTCKAVLALVDSWELYEKPSPGVEEALAIAESLVRTAEDAYALAAASLGSDRARARRALARAASGPMDATLTAQVAAAYVDWFDDAATADRIGPRGIRPEEPRLLDWLRARITGDDLDRIAHADYSKDFEKHRQALAWICEHGLVPPRLSWTPGEVLRLTRWGYDATPQDIALSCTILLLCSDEDDLFNCGATLIPACRTLGKEAIEHCRSLLQWRAEQRASSEPEQALAYLLQSILGDDGAHTLYEQHPTRDRVAVELAEAVQSESWRELLKNEVL